MLDGAYAFLDTYIFCRSMFVAPVTTPVDNQTQLAQRSLWLPPGLWVNTAHGNTIQAGPSGRNVTLNFTLWEVPVFVLTGTIIPLGT